MVVSSPPQHLVYLHYKQIIDMRELHNAKYANRDIYSWSDIVVLAQLR